MTTTSSVSTDPVVRPARADDADEVRRLYEVCLKTGASGDDATEHFADHQILGHVYVGPYLRFVPELAWVVARPWMPADGYILGVADTIAFEDRLEREWWPELRDALRATRAPDDTADAIVRRLIANPPRTPHELAAQYPAHLHIDLLPSVQGGGHGRLLIDTLLASLRAEGVRGVHLGVGLTNTRAIGFYRHLGFERLAETPDALTLGLKM